MKIPAADRVNQIQEYYFSKKLQEVNTLRQKGVDIINLGIGNPDLPPSPQTIDMLCQSARSADNHGYQPYRGIPELREAIASWYQRTYQVVINPETEVLPLIGSKEGVFHISMTFLNRKERVLVPDPGYAAYAAAARIAGAEPIYYDLSEENGWLPDLSEIRKLDIETVKLMWINYPHMPTGALASEEDFRKLIAFARDNQIMLVHDNPYSLILNPHPPLSILKMEDAFEWCIELNSLSKSHHMAGWRVGMAISQRKYLDAVIKLKSNVDTGMFRPIQQAAVQALHNSTEWHHQQNKIYQQRRESAYQFLDNLNFSYRTTDTAGMFVWAKAPAKIDDVDAFIDRLLYRTGIFLTPGSVFGKNGKRYIRVSLCAGEEKIRSAIERIHKFQKSDSN